MPDVGKRSLAGRPEATSHAAIEQAAFRLFAERGFDATTLDAIAAEVGVGRRTLFRYYASKNDIPWGQFDGTLDAFRKILTSMPTDLSLHVAIHRAVLAFNDFPLDARPPHLERMRLILLTPTLQAHSVLRFTQWRAVIAEHAADRLGLAPDDLMPRTVGQVSLALALSAYEEWFRSPETPLLVLLDESMAAIRQHLAD
jgi:TetR/AcrR family transcriptional regulator, regulator of mycofactocin system